MASTMPTTVPPSTTTISFPRRQWAARDNRLTLTLTATAHLVWLPSASAAAAASGTAPSSSIFHAAIVAAARVAQLVRAGRLWVGADGRSVRLGINATLGGKSCFTPQQLDTIRQKVADWPWAELGLVQRTDDLGGGRRLKGRSLVMCHPPSRDGLYAPRGIPHARMDRVDCQLRFNYCADGFDLPVVKAAKTKRAKAKGKMSRANKAERKPKAPPVSPDCLFNERDGAWARMAALVDAALATLVGTAGRQVGARALDPQSLPSGAPSLFDIAPAVWSHHLFRATASRAAHVPLIYRALSTFTNAQSPSLRRKAEALAGLPATADGPARQGQGQGQDELATKIEEILLKGTLFEPQRLKRTCQKKRRAPETQVSHLPSPEPTAVPSTQQQSHEEDIVGTVDMCQDEPEESFCDLDADSLEYAFDLSQGSVDKDGGHAEGYGDGASEAGEAVDWNDIEAWTEQHDAWPGEDEDEDGEKEGEDNEFNEFTGSWSPLGYDDASDAPASDGHDGADWADVDDGQLDAALACADRLRVPRPDDDEHAEYMDIDEMGLDCMGYDDMGDDIRSQADEGIGMWHWRSEHEMMSRVL